MVFGRALLGGIAAVAFAVSPALAGKRDDTLKVASGVVPESVDAYMNNVREGVILDLLNGSAPNGFGDASGAELA